MTGPRHYKGAWCFRQTMQRVNSPIDPARPAFFRDMENEGPPPHVRLTTGKLAENDHGH